MDINEKMKLVNDGIKKLQQDAKNYDSIYLSNELDEILKLINDNYEENIDLILDKMNKLIEERDSYINFNIINKVFDDTYNELRSETINKDLVNACSNLVIEVFKNIESEKLYEQEINKKIIDMFCDKAYRIMQCELLFSDNSLIYDYVKDNDYLKEIFKKIISDRYKMLKLDFLEDIKVLDKTVSQKLFSIETSLDKDIFNLDVIKFLSSIDTFNSSYIEKANEETKEKLKDLESVVNELSTIEKRYIRNKTALEHTKIGNKKNKQLLKIRLCSLAVTAGIIISSLVGISGSVKKACKENYYNANIIKYSSVDSDPKVIPVLVSTKGNPKDSTKVNVYSKVYERGIFDKKVRTVSTYDVTDYTQTNIKDYLDIDYSTLDFNISEIKYDDSTSSNEYSEVVNIKIDKSETKSLVNTNDYIFYLSLIGIFLELCLSVISLIHNRKKIAESKINLGIIANGIATLLPPKKYGESLLDKLQSYNTVINEYNVDLEKLSKYIDDLLIECLSKESMFKEAYKRNEYYLNDNTSLNNIYLELHDQVGCIKRRLRKK